VSFNISWSLIELADIEVDRGNYVCAAGHYREILDRWNETRSNEILVIAITQIAGLACTRGTPEGAVALLSALDALERAARLAPVPRVFKRAARVREHAESLLSAERFAAAWEQERHVTVEQLISDAENVLESICVRPSSAPSRPVVGLTAREMDVIRLVSAGKSNREIARELSIGETTAISHVRNILSKLGLSSRTAVAAWAIRHGFDKPL
jgi:DNA-binding CsgD family transcriptional regulator